MSKTIENALTVVRRITVNGDATVFKSDESDFSVGLNILQECLYKCSTVVYGNAV